MDYTFSANQPYTETQKWWRGPWGRDESCDQLKKLIKEPDFLVIESDWELTAAQHHKLRSTEKKIPYRL